MKFAHLADVHLGSWKEPKLRELSTKAFVRAVNTCIEQNVDFVLISGDLFNTSLPSIDTLKTAVAELKLLKEEGIAVYVIAGSHDFSPSGKTMLEVLEEAELVVNVFKGNVLNGSLKLDFTIDAKTGAKITGMIGKKGLLEKSNYDGLVRAALEEQDGFKIFMFHTALSELKPEEMEKMDSYSLSVLPRHFDYYAGGHVHITKKADFDGYRNVVYPGPVFPNSFSEIEKLRHGGFYIYDSGKTSYHPLSVCGVVDISLDCTGKTPDNVTEEVMRLVDEANLSSSLFLLRLSGRLESGKTSEIDIRKIFDIAREKGALFSMRNTARLSSKDFDEVKVAAETTGEAEDLVIEKHLGQNTSINLTKDEEKELVRRLMHALDIEKEEGERVSDYEERVFEGAKKVLSSQK